MYKAKIDIGGFKKGEIVPKDLAETWIRMYKVSPIEEIHEKFQKIEKKKKSKKKLKK